MVRQRLTERHQIHLRSAIEDEASMHVLLAAGAYYTSDPTRAIQHKIKAISLLRREMSKSVQTYFTVRLLTSLEFFIGDLGAAETHYQAAKWIVSSFPDLEASSVDPLPVMEVNLALSSLTHKALNMDEWDPRTRSLGLMNHYVSVPQEELAEHLAGAHEIAQMLARGEETLAEHEVKWLYLRAAAVSGRLHKHLLDHFDFDLCATSHPLLVAINVAISCAVQVLFVEHRYSHIQRAWHLPDGRWLLEQIGSDCDRHLLLWLYFMFSVRERLLHSSSLRWTSERFQSLQESMSLSWSERKGALRHFVYLERMEQTLLLGQQSRRFTSE